MPHSIQARSHRVRRSLLGAVIAPVVIATALAMTGGDNGRHNHLGTLGFDAA
jgi:hypothetical protein